MSKPINTAIKIGAAISLVVAILLALPPISGKVTPSIRYRSAISKTEQLVRRFHNYAVSHAEESSSGPAHFLREVAKELPSALFVYDPHSPHQPIYFIDVHEATGGTILLAASAAIIKPKTNEKVRLIVHSTDNVVVVPELEFQSLLKRSEHEN